jgi:hypothetical protein
MFVTLILLRVLYCVMPVYIKEIHETKTKKTDKNKKCITEKVIKNQMECFICILVLINLKYTFIKMTLNLFWGLIIKNNLI